MRPLPNFLESDGRILVCWRCLSWLERLRVFFTGQVWLEMNTPTHPVDLQSLQDRLAMLDRVSREREQVKRWKVGPELNRKERP